MTHAEVCNTKKSKELDSSVRAVSKLAYEILKQSNKNLEHKYRVDKSKTFGTACSPDGGLWFKDGKLVLAIEAKSNGTRGNALERWYKNYSICKYLNPDCVYLTFVSGAGCSCGLVESVLGFATRGVFNDINSTTPVMMNDEGFTKKFILNTIITIIERV